MKYPLREWVGGNPDVRASGEGARVVLSGTVQRTLRDSLPLNQKTLGNKIIQVLIVLLSGVLLRSGFDWTNA